MSKRKIIENDFDFNNFSKKKKNNNNDIRIFTKIIFIILGILMVVSFFTPTTYGDFDDYRLNCKIANNCQYYG